VCRVQIARQHQLECQFVRTGRRTHPNAGFDVQDFSAMIEYGPDFMKLLIRLVEVA
jgi:hypothetical protein